MKAPANRMEVVIRARAAVHGESEDVLRKAFLAELKNKPDILKKFLEPLEEEKAEASLLELRVHMETMKSYADSDPDGFMKMLQEKFGPDPETMRKYQSVYASHE